MTPPLLFLPQSHAEMDAMDLSAPEEVLLDENVEAAKHSFYMVGGFEVSPDHRWVGGGTLRGVLHGTASYLKLPQGLRL